MNVIPSLNISSYWYLPPPYRHREDFRCVIFGLDEAGKTTILYRMKQPEEKEMIFSIPTIGWNVETISITDKVAFTAWDIGGRAQIRPLYKHFYANTQAVVMVVDSNDVARMDEARDLLHTIMESNHLKDVALLVLCNKQDLPNAMDPTKISEKLEISRLHNHKDRVFVQGCSAKTSTGYKEGFVKLAKCVKESWRNAMASRKTSTSHKSIFSTSIFPDHRPKLDMTKHDRHNLTLERFSSIQGNIQDNPSFTNMTKLWGGKTFFVDQNNHIACVEEQAKANVETLVEFTKEFHKGKNDIDGFCIEINDEMARSTNATPDEIDDFVRRILTTIADHDPATTTTHHSSTSTRKDVVKESTTAMPTSSTFGKRKHGWQFQFHKTDYFVTVFAPCFPKTSIHFTYGLNRAFVLLQPETMHNDDDTTSFCSSSDDTMTTTTDEIQSWEMVEEADTA